MTSFKMVGNGMATIEGATSNPDNEPFFASKYDAWMFMSDVTDDLYKMLMIINRDSAALAHIGELTGDMVTLRYLVRKCWEHYHKRDDELYDEFEASGEENPH